MKNVVNDWSFRNLSLIGRTTVIKTLVLPIIIQCLTVLPDPPDYIYDQIQNMLISFLWCGKPDKIKRTIIVNNIEEGGLAFPHIRSFGHSLKMTWIKTLLDPEKFAAWKTLALNNFEIFGGNKIWYFHKEGLLKLSNKMNSFWKCVLKSWSQLDSKTLSTTEDILSEPLYYNNKIKINNQKIFYKELCKKEIFFINDLIDDNGSILPFHVIKAKLNLNVPFITYFSLVNAIPKCWKTQIKNDQK